MAMVSGSLNAVFGVFIGLFFLAMSLFASGSGSAEELPIVFGALAPIALPILYGFMGYVMGALVAVVYNFIAKRVGGIEFETE